MMLCPVNDWTCPCFDSEGEGKCMLRYSDSTYGYLSCEFLSDISDSGNEGE